MPATIGFHVDYDPCIRVFAVSVCVEVDLAFKLT